VVEDAVGPGPEDRPEVVAPPALPDPDPAAVDLLDDGVQLVVVGEQVLEVAARLAKVRPSSGSTRAPGGRLN
jgi:hypothetical protein